MSVICANPRPHSIRAFRNGAWVAKEKPFCDNIFKIYKEPAEFEEIYFCPKCSAHVRIIKKIGQLATALILPDDVQIKHKHLPVRWVSEKPEKKKAKHGN